MPIFLPNSKVKQATGDSKLKGASKKLNPRVAISRAHSMNHIASPESILYKNFWAKTTTSIFLGFS
jgi:hypothetical protein